MWKTSVVLLGFGILACLRPDAVEAKAIPERIAPKHHEPHDWAWYSGLVSQPQLQTQTQFLNVSLFVFFPLLQ